MHSKLSTELNQTMPTPKCLSLIPNGGGKLSTEMRGKQLKHTFHFGWYMWYGLDNSYQSIGSPFLKQTTM